ncbi:MAG TPA: phosphoadenylyl-sulfate reductase, partial [Blastocatellia bacterium]
MAQALDELIQLEPTVRVHGQLDEIAARLEEAQPEEILRWAFDEFGDRVTIATGLGAEGIALLDIAVRVNPRPQVFFLDTAFLFPETYELRRRLEERYRIEIRAFQPQLSPEAQELSFGPKLWSADPDLCCRLRKLEPLGEALKGYAAWITAIRRDQTEARSTAGVVEWDYQWKLVKINPLARWSRSDVWGYIRKNDVPYNPLHDRGYPSIGCTHCTRAVGAGEDERAGRWSGLAKIECGLHSRTGGLSPPADLNRRS